MKHIEINCTADPRDVLSVKTNARDDLISCIFEKLKSIIPDSAPVLLSRSFNTLDAVFKIETDISTEQIEAELKALSLKYSIKDIHVSFTNVSESRVSEISNVRPQSEGSFAEAKAPAVEAAESKPEPEQNDSSYEDIQALIGMNELKAWADEIEALAKNCPSAEMLSDIIFSMSYIVSIDSGSGCTTLLKRMGALILKHTSKDTLCVKERVLTLENDQDRTIEHVLAEIDEIKNNNKLYIFALHIDRIQGYLKTEKWTEFLETCWHKNKNAIFVFIAPVLEDLVLSELHENINDVLSNKVIRIEPLSNDDYICHFEKYFSKYGIKADPDVYSLLFEKISEEKNDGRFHGINTIYKVCDEILYCKFKSNADDSRNDIITKDDVLNVLPLMSDDSLSISGYEALENLVSLEKVKAKVKEIVSSVKFSKKMDKTAATTMHMMFSGAPGTGKTEVARIIGKIFREERILSRGDFFEVTRKDLVGTYVGSTAPKTALACRNAYGSILFIDEAYMLNGGSINDYGNEAISTLIAEMENNRDKLIVIFAGYENELESLFDMNPGLRDRIPYRIQFDNYSKDELRQIFYKKIPARFSYTEDFEKCADAYFNDLPDEFLNDENFSNARFVRNIAERVISKAALRFQSQTDESADPILIESDFNLAVSDTEFNILNTKKKTRRIGF